MRAAPAVSPVVLTQLAHILVSVELVVANVSIVLPDTAVVGVAVLTILPEILAILLPIDPLRRGLGALRRSTCCEEAGEGESHECMADVS